MCFVSLQIHYDRSQWVFFVQMKSSPMCYDVIYHPFPINPKNLKTLVVDSPCITNMYVES